jgi:hypothetical protein
MDKTTKSRLSAVAIFAVTFAIAFFGTKYFFSGNSADKELGAIAAEMNRSNPVQVDSETRLESVESLGGAKVRYNFTLVNVDKQTTSLDLEELQASIKENAQRILNENAKMEAFRKANVTMQYHYKDKNGKELFDFSIAPAKNN